ncbi:MAG: bifunctional 4-hydroxy-2-oxoglutarate aldolase/2-dehydro-3-deoxy-phosphogluconate aldolase [Nocardioidaceae bacterium]|nr:bifunctional 4-hydroxy-2-oxoglutarate aldolase/2-dehydro-3-deoxy-phosphogluconate aldolase [Nocardioidaceae bacterium]
MTDRPRTAEQVLELLGVQRCIAIVRSQSPEGALAASRALVAAGFTAVEITYTTPRATELLSTLRAEYGDRILLGAGTVSSAGQAGGATNAGADFLVCPGSPPELVRAMLETGRLVVPGVLTPTEIMTVRAAGALVVKLFPAAMVGPAGLAALRGPFPDLAVIPSGGVAIEEVGSWLAAGAHAVGLGSGLTSTGSDPSRHLVSTAAAQLLDTLRSAGGAAQDRR